MSDPIVSIVVGVICLITFAISDATLEDDKWVWWLRVLVLILGVLSIAIAMLKLIP